MAEDMFPQPSVGRIVHYKTDAGQCWAAMITQVYESGEAGLMVQPPGAHAVVLDAVKRGSIEGTWHWPERV